MNSTNQTLTVHRQSGREGAHRDRVGGTVVGRIRLGAASGGQGELPGAEVQRGGLRAGKIELEPGTPRWTMRCRRLGHKC